MPGRLFAIFIRWLFQRGEIERAKVSFAKTHHQSWLQREWAQFTFIGAARRSCVWLILCCNRADALLKTYAYCASHCLATAVNGVNPILQFSAYLLREMDYL